MPRFAFAKRTVVLGRINLMPLLSMPYILLSLAAIFWGGNYVVGRMLVSDINPIMLSEMRWALTAVLLFSIYFGRIRKELHEAMSQWGRIVLLALLGQVIFPVTLYVALQSTTSLRTALYISATPCFVVLINRIVFGESLNQRALFGILLSTVGVGVIFSEGNLKRVFADGSISAGDIWAMGSALSWAFYCACLRVKRKGLSGESFVAISSLIGALALMPLALYKAFSLHQGLSLWLNVPQAAGVAYLVIFPSWLAYLFWNKGIAKVGASRGDVFTHLIPVTGGVFGIVFLDESFRGYHLLGAGFVLVGLFFCGRKRDQLIRIELPEARLNSSRTDG